MKLIIMPQDWFKRRPPDKEKLLSNREAVLESRRLHLANLWTRIMWVFTSVK
jgi:hypothetical protein